MKKLSVLISTLALGLFLSGTAHAQEEATEAEPATEEAAPEGEAPAGAPAEAGAPGEGFNKFSLRPIHESDIMYRKTILRAMDLREKQNKPMFSKNKEITKLILEATQRGELTPYATDSLSDGRKLTIKEFEDAMRIPSSLDTTSLYDMYGPDWRTNPEVSGMLATQFFFPQDLYQMQIKEDLIFDKQRSRMYYDIHSITILVPADHPQNVKGIEIPVASYEYKELVEKLFKDNPNAIWYNPKNDSEHKSLADAFELRLFSSYILKVSNPSNAYLVDIYGGDQTKGIMASQWAAFDLLEYEHNLWEF
jgi:gliding motility associated protien GldN